MIQEFPIVQDWIDEGKQKGLREGRIIGLRKGQEKALYCIGNSFWIN